jgi:exopolysaccharide biosynthesis polyprenyl glycosylphosphotransferase
VHVHATFARNVTERRDLDEPLSTTSWRDDDALRTVHDVGLKAGDSRALKLFLVAVDALVLIAAWAPVNIGARHAAGRTLGVSFLVTLTITAVALVVMRQLGLYLGRLCAIRSIEIRLLARATVYTALALVVLDRTVLPRIGMHLRLNELALGSLVMLVLLIVERSAVRSLLRVTRQRGGRQRDVLVLGSGAHAARLVQLIGDHPDYGTRVAGVMGNRVAAFANGLGALWLGDIDDLDAVLDQRRITGVVLSAASIEHPEIAAIVKHLHGRGVHVQVSNGLTGFDVERMRQLHLARDPMIYLEPPTPGRRRLATKRAIDLAVSIGTLVVLSPVLVAIAIMIKVSDRGPVFFKQHRVGRNGSLFEVYKFRTMVVDAERLKAQLEAANERNGPLFKMDVDPRVTRVGRFLRLSSLDEVPQLFNVVRGEMSIVGPRPALPSEVLSFDADLRRRELVKPGITGLWQVEARDSPSFDAYRRLDLFYVDNWTITGDFDIMLDTAEHLFGRIFGTILGVKPDAPTSPTEPTPTADVRSFPARDATVAG